MACKLAGDLLFKLFKNNIYFEYLKKIHFPLQPCSIKLKISKKSWSEKKFFLNGKVF